jgi:hypothetical protein
MGDAHGQGGSFAERHAWQVFLALGVIWIFFGSSDLTEASTYDAKLAAMSLLVIGLFGTAIAVTAVRDGARWAWLTMFVWPLFGLSYTIFQLGTPFAAIDVGMLAWVAAFVVVPLLALAVSGRRYLR